MGSLQAEEPLLGKEVDGPALMIGAPGEASHPSVATQQASQPTAQPTVKVGERRAVAMLEVDEPAPQRRIEALDDRAQALPWIVPRGVV